MDFPSFRYNLPSSSIVLPLPTLGRFLELSSLSEHSRFAEESILELGQLGSECRLCSVNLGIPRERLLAMLSLILVWKMALLALQVAFQQW